jgi:hypothetical protein
MIPNKIMTRIKKHLFTTLLLLFIVFSSFGQNRFVDPEVSLGIHGGYGVSMVNFSPTVKQNMFQGLNSGLIFRYIAERNVGIQAELNYVQKGWLEADNLYSRELNYIEIPFMTHIYFGKNVRFFINFGPEISYLLTENVLINSTNDTESEQHITAVQNPFEYGLCGGFGISFKIKQQIFQLETRVQYSLSDIFSNQKVDYFDNSNNMGISAGVAWLIQFKNKK